MKKPTDSGLKKNSAAVKKFLEELAKIGNLCVFFYTCIELIRLLLDYRKTLDFGLSIRYFVCVLSEFPGSKAVSDATTKFGTSYVTGPITFIFEKVASLLPEEPPAPAEETTSKEVTAEVIEEIKKEEAEKAELETPAATETPATTEPAEVVAEATPPPAAPTPTPEPEPAKPAEPEPEAAKA